MTSVTITKHNGEITSVVCDGHTNYGVSGEDIVCSALSSIVQTAVLGLLTVAKINVSLKRNEKKGFLELKLPQNLTESEKHDAKVILETMICGLNDLREGFSDFIELEVKE
jgi:uncharacterized protein YsxB (DUF464 family)